MIHSEPSPLAGKTVKIKPDAKHFQQDEFGGEDYQVEDWWDRVSGESWGVCKGNPACIVYALRISQSAQPIPNDDEVLYGKVGCLGHLVHISELQNET
jgi:hypothetical protein